MFTEDSDSAYPSQSRRFVAISVIICSVTAIIVTLVVVKLINNKVSMRVCSFNAIDMKVYIFFLL